MKIVQSLLAKHPDEEFPVSRKNRIEAAAVEYARLKDKWAERIPPAWYGFDINDVPVRWLRIIDGLLDHIAKRDPDLEIHQIKLKFGGLRFYVNCSSEFKDEIAELEEHLYDTRLI